MKAALRASMTICLSFDNSVCFQWDSRWPPCRPGSRVSSSRPSETPRNHMLSSGKHMVSACFQWHSRWWRRRWQASRVRPGPLGGTRPSVGSISCLFLVFSSPWQELGLAGAYKPPACAELKHRKSTGKPYGFPVEAHGCGVPEACPGRNQGAWH
jgi:hypothetical protein